MPVIGADRELDATTPQKRAKKNLNPQEALLI